MDVVCDDTDLWRLTLEHSPIGMTLVGLDGRLLVFNQALCDMLGFEAQRLTGLRLRDLSHPDDLVAELEVFGRVAVGEVDSYRLRKRYLHADGHVVWGDLSVALVRGRDHRPVHLVAQILDVTEQQDQERRLETAGAKVEHDHQTLEAIFEAVSVGLLLIGRDGHYERMNQRHRDTMGLAFPDGHSGTAGQLGQVYSLDGKTLLAKEDMPSYRAVQGEEFDDYAYWAGDDPSTRAAFSTSARQVRGPGGEILGAVLAYQEITDLMRAMQVKDEFVSSVSHELRTPLTSVLGYLEMLCDHEDLPAEVTAQLRVVQRNALRLRTLLSDLLHVGQVSEDCLQLQRTSVDLVMLVDEAVQAARPSAAEHGMTVEVEAPEDLAAFVDEHRIRQVLDNLLSNALKYGQPGGSATVVLSRSGDSIELEVRDTGMGIAQDEVEHVFDRFFRGQHALEKHLPGTGLGLNIVGSIVSAHDGCVTLDSEVGRGSTFRVTLPAGTSARNPSGELTGA